jgi:hypothetical protein
MAKPTIGLGQLGKLCQLKQSDRLVLLSEGFPIIAESANSFLAAADALKAHARERDVLVAYAAEEAAKALILMDIVRCPKKIAPALIGKMTKWFYSHLVRLIYVDAYHWRPADTSQLQDYANSLRKTHHVDGEYGEYIFPNWPLYMRESRLYADLEAGEDGELGWSAPKGSDDPILFNMTPTVCEVAQALSKVGAFSRKGVEIVANVWSTTEFKATEGYVEARALINETLDALIEAGLPSPDAEEGDVSILFERWQYPMYHLDLSTIEVSLEELERERERLHPYEW